MIISNPVLIGDAIFGLSQRASGQFFALDARTGKVLWLHEPREATNTAIVKAGNLLFLLNETRELVVAGETVDGLEPVRRYTVADNATWASRRSRATGFSSRTSRPGPLDGRIAGAEVSEVTVQHGGTEERRAAQKTLQRATSAA